MMQYVRTGLRFGFYRGIASMKKFLLGSAAFLVGSLVCLFPIESRATLPVSHIKGMDELFVPHYKLYSPLTGLLEHSTLVPTEYSGSPSEPITKLVTTLFVKI